MQSLKRATLYFLVDMSSFVNIKNLVINELSLESMCHFDSIWCLKRLAYISLKAQLQAFSPNLNNFLQWIEQRGCQLRQCDMAPIYHTDIAINHIHMFCKRLRKCQFACATNDVENLLQFCRMVSPIRYV